MNTDAIIIEYGNGTLTAEDFVDDGFILEENLCSASQIAFGACEAAAVEVRIASTAASFVGKTLTVKLGANALGKYKVVSDERAYDGETRILKAYDALYDVNGKDVSAWYESIDWNVITTLKKFRDSFFRYLGITQATADLVNDEMPVKKTMEASSCSGATILQAICEVNGVFGHMNANGHFQYVSLSNGEPTVVNADEVLDSLTEDFTVPAFDGVLIRTEEGDIGGQYPASGAQNQYIITGNFLCYGKTTAELQSIAQNALSKIGGKTYVPFEADLECQGNITLGGKVTIPTEPATFTSYVLQRKLVGFEDLEEYFVAQGSPEYVPDVNSARNQMVATSQRINKLTSTVEGTESRVAEIEKDYAKESVIKQLPHEILLQASETSEGGTPQKATITLTVKDGKGSVVSTEAVDILFNGLVTFTNNAKQAAIDAAATDATNKTKAITDHIYKAGTTSIDGGVIDTESLFARDITATNLNITGGSIRLNTSIEKEDYIHLAYDGGTRKYKSYMTPKQIGVVNETDGVVINNGIVRFERTKRLDLEGYGTDGFEDVGTIGVSVNETNPELTVNANATLNLLGNAIYIGHRQDSAKFFSMGPNGFFLRDSKFQIEAPIFTNSSITFYGTGAVFNGSYDSLTGKPTIPTSLPANGGTADYAAKIQTWKSDGTGTYGSSYPIYAKWLTSGTHVKFKCDNYKVDVDYADTAGSAPASDVYAWAKAATKPSYTASEVGAQPSGYYVNSGEFTVSGGTIDNLWNSLRYTTGAHGSVQLNKKSSGTGAEIPAGWYNVEYIPHRYGTNTGDNGNYGTIILFPMTFDGESWIIRCTGGAIASVKPFVDQSETLTATYVPASLTVGQAKTKILEMMSGKVSGRFGKTIMVPASYITQWSDDSKSYFDASMYGMTALNPAYDGNTYGHYLLTHYGPNKIGYVGRNGSAWTKTYWLATTDDIPTNTNQLTNGAGFITGITKAMVTTALGYTPPTSDTGGTSLSISGNSLSLVRGTSTLSTVTIPTSGGGGGGTSAHFHHWNKLNSSALAVNGTCQWTYGQYDSIAVTGAWRGSIRSTMIIPLPDIENLTIGTAKSYDMTFWGSNWLQFTLTKNNNGMVTLTYTAYNTSAQNSDGTIIEAIYGQGNIIT